MPKTLLLVVSGTRDLKYLVLGPSGEGRGKANSRPLERKFRSGNALVSAYMLMALPPVMT